MGTLGKLTTYEGVRNGSGEKGGTRFCFLQVCIISLLKDGIDRAYSTKLSALFIRIV